MTDTTKILTPIPALIHHQTDSPCVVVLALDTEGEYHIVANGSGWQTMVLECAAKVLKDSRKKQEVQND